MRTVRRPRRYVHRRLLAALTPAFAYNANRDAYVLRVIGRRFGPVLRPDRRVQREATFDGGDLRRGARAA